MLNYATPGEFMQQFPGIVDDIKSGTDITSDEYKHGVSYTNSAHAANTGTTSGGVAFVGNSPDSYANALNQEKTWLREDMIRKEGYAREDNAYHRLFSELKSLGVNPALLMSSVGPTVGNAGGYSTSAFKTNNMASTDRTDAANSARVAASLIAAVALIAAAIL